MTGEGARDFTVHVQKPGGGWTYMVGKYNSSLSTILLIFFIVFFTPSLKERKIKIRKLKNALFIPEERHGNIVVISLGQKLK